MESFHGWAWMILTPALGYAYTVHKAEQSSTAKKLSTLIPLVPLFVFIPWQPSSCHVRAIVCTVMLWTAPCKLILLSLRRPFDPAPWTLSSLPNFVASVLLPVRIDAGGGKRPSKLTAVTVAGKILKLVLLITLLNSYTVFPDMTEELRYLLYGCQFYIGLELFMTGVASAVDLAFHVATLAPFDEPMLSVSLAEFWGRRWNRVVGGILRVTVYEPLLQMSGGHHHRRGMAVLATFFVSGLLHELVFVYVGRSQPTGHMTAFFLVHGLATIAQSALFYVFPSLPNWFRRALTLMFLYVSASLLFLRPLRQSGIDLIALVEYHRLQSASLSWIHGYMIIPAVGLV